MAKAIDSVHVFYTRAGDSEQVLWFASSRGPSPLVCLDAAHLDNFRRIAQNEARERQCPVVMKSFLTGTIAEVIEPGAPAEGKP